MRIQGKKTFIPLAALAVLLITSLACSSLGNAVETPASPGEQSPTNESGPAEEPLPTEESATISGCNHPFYPIVQGANWVYAMNGTTSDTYTHSIVSVTKDGFVDQDVFGSGTTRTGGWKCEDGNLITLTPGGSASVAAAGETFNFTVTSNSGTTLPANLDIGSTWSQEITYEGVQEAGGMNLNSVNTATTSCTATGRESVTVPAGTFDAVKADCNNSISISISGGEPILLQMTSTSWYAQGVGMVKTVSSGSGFDSTILLQSYQIP